MQMRKVAVATRRGGPRGHRYASPISRSKTMKREMLVRTMWLGLLTMLAAVVVSSTPAAAQQQQRPNIVFIMGDDIGWANIGVYNQGIMAGRTPNLDQLAAEGMRFTDYYAEASCT